MTERLSLTHSLSATVDFGLQPGKGCEQGLGDHQAVLSAPVPQPERVQLLLQGWSGHSSVPDTSWPLLRLPLSPWGSPFQQ